MNILIAYATNSGSTFLVAQHIQEALADAHQVNILQISEITPGHIDQHDLVMFGSPSWDTGKKEGQPHADFFTFMETHSAVDLASKKCAVFGLGDKNYYYFCGAVDHLERFIQQKNGQLIHESLRVNQFYFQPESAQQSIKAWCEQLKLQLARA